MTNAQRAKQNRANAEHSTGPKTEEGKNVSRGNALKHGLTAELLTLPGENSEEIREQADAWVEALRPASHDEDFLVEQIAISALKMKRCVNAEAAIVAEQIRNAKIVWTHERGERQLNLIRMFRKDPVRAVFEMKHSADGVSWLIERWGNLELAFRQLRCWNSLALIREALCLSGYDHNRLAEESLVAYRFALQACSCIDGYKDEAVLTEYLAKQMPARGAGIFKGLEYSYEEAAKLVRARIDDTLAELNALSAMLVADEKASRQGAKTRALVLADTAANRLFLRYMKSTENGFDRAIKTLAKLQSDRKKAAEKEAETVNEGVPRNEAGVRAKASSNPVHPGSYVSINRVDYEVADFNDGNLLLMPFVPQAYTADLEPSPGSENDV